MKPPKGLDWLDIALILIVITGIVAFGLYMGNKYPSVKDTKETQASSTAELSLTEYINNYRKENSKPALTEHEALNEAAQERADEIAKCSKECYSHTRPDGTSWNTSIDDIKQFKGAGENLVECAVSNDEAVNSWKQSDGHNKNMLGILTEQMADWTYVGVARAYDEKNKCNVYVAEFAR